MRSVVNKFHTILLNKNQKKKKTVRIGARDAARIGELFGHVCGVLFSPEDLSIVKEGPAERRRFLDMQLSQLRPQYFYSLQRAVRTLNQRNTLLKEIASFENIGTELSEAMSVKKDIARVMTILHEKNA